MPTIDLEFHEYEFGQLVYGGMCDPTNVTSLSSIHSELKLAAILFDHIIIPDSFLYTTSNVTTDLLRRKQKSLLSKFLSANIAVPTIRSRGANGHYQNLERSRDRGADFGKYLILGEADAFRVGEIVDESLPKYAYWPQDMAEGTTAEFGEGLLDHFHKNANSAVQRHSDPADHPGVQMMARDFLKFLDDRSDDTKFGHRHLEDFFNPLFATKRTDFKKFFKEANSPIERFAEETLRESRTIYQIYQSRKFKTDVNFFSFFSPHVFRSGRSSPTISLEAPIDVSPANPTYSIWDLLFMFDVTQIVQLRSKPARRQLVKLIGDHRRSPSEQSFVGLIDYLNGEFREAVYEVVREIPNLIDKDSLLAKLGDGAEFASGVQSVDSDAFEWAFNILGVPAVTSLVGAAADAVSGFGMVKWLVKGVAAKKRTEVTVSNLDRFILRNSYAGSRFRQRNCV